MYTYTYLGSHMLSDQYWLNWMMQLSKGKRWAECTEQTTTKTRWKAVLNIKISFSVPVLSFINLLPVLSFINLLPVLSFINLLPVLSFINFATSVVFYLFNNVILMVFYVVLPSLLSTSPLPPPHPPPPPNPPPLHPRMVTWSYVIDTPNTVYAWNTVYWQQGSSY